MFIFFFFNDTATTEIYTLSLHDALPICPRPAGPSRCPGGGGPSPRARSEEHTSELQSQSNLVCRLLLEKKQDTAPHELEVPERTPQRTCHVRQNAMPSVRPRQLMCCAPD